jgi:hypothetical protein
MRDIKDTLATAALFTGFAGAVGALAWSGWILTTLLVAPVIV